MRRVPQLDGVRGIAVLLVVATHFAGGAFPADRPFFGDWPWRTSGGGLVGVQIFFVLSGYLITSILVREVNGTGTLSMRDFYGRRVRRLVPALLAVCVVYIAYVTFNHDDLKAAGYEVIYAVTYTSNLYFVIRLPSSRWLSHAWSLAIEEQFYLVWPIVVRTLRRRPDVLRWIALSVIGASIILRHLVFVVLSTTHAEQMSYNLLRWDAIMLGSVIALLPKDRLRLPRGFHTASVVVIAGLFLWLPSPIPPWFYTVATIAAGVFLVGAPATRWLANPVLRHFGTISYGLYLWHVLILRLGWPGLPSLVVSIAVAELSFRFIEAPFLHKRPVTSAAQRPPEHHDDQPDGEPDHASSNVTGPSVNTEVDSATRRTTR